MRGLLWVRSREMRRHSLAATILLILASSLACSAIAGTPTQRYWDLSVGAMYSPTQYGGDRGTTFWSGAITRLESQWGVRAEVMHGRYSDYPDAGPAEFTPIGIGIRYSP